MRFAIMNGLACAGLLWICGALLMDDVESLTYGLLMTTPAMGWYSFQAGRSVKRLIEKLF